MVEKKTDLCYNSKQYFNEEKSGSMKKIISLFAIILLLFTIMTGCSKTDNLKLCRIEITDQNHNVIAVLENQTQADVSELLDETNWKETDKPSDKLINEYVVSVYQERTKTVIKTDKDDEYIKIMEYETFENADVVKVSIGGDLVNSPASEELLDEYLEDYYIASSDFFSKINNIVSAKAV